MQKEGLGVGYPADHSSYADDPGSDSTAVDEDRIQPRPEGEAAGLFIRGRDEWARYRGIAPAGGPKVANTQQADQVGPQRSTHAGGNLPQTSPDEVNVNHDKPMEERRELLRYVEEEGLYLPCAQLPLGTDEDLPPKQVERQDENARLHPVVKPKQAPALATGPVLSPFWASAQALVQWLEANTVVSGSVPPPQPERHQRPLQTDGYLRHEQRPANPLDHDRLLNEQRERLKQQAALEDREDPSTRRRWNGYRPPREEVLRKRREKKLRNRACRAEANQAFKRRKAAMQEKRHQDMSARRYQAELAVQRRCHE
jgi:hypothetical protein